MMSFDHVLKQEPVRRKEGDGDAAVEDEAGNGACIHVDGGLVTPPFFLINTAGLCVRVIVSKVQGQGGQCRRLRRFKH